MYGSVPAMKCAESIPENRQVEIQEHYLASCS